MTFEGAQFQGKAPIMEKLASLPFQKVQHQVTTMDAQPIIGVDDNKVRNHRSILRVVSPPQKFDETIICC